MTGPDLSFLADPHEAADWRLVLLLDVATEAGLLDALPGQPAEVATRLGLDERSVRVVLEALAAWDVVAADGTGAFALGGAAPDAEAGQVLHHHARALRNWTASLDERLRRGAVGDGSPATGGPPTAIKDPARWLAALAVGARKAAPAVVDACLAAAPAAEAVLDLGGGHGEYALEFARRGLKATLQDRPTIIDILRAEGRFESAGVELLAGDFFEVLAPGQYDLVFCSGVTHTFDGARVRELFRRTAAIVAPGGVLAVQTFLRGRHRVGAIFAVQMLANGGGGDTHSEDEYRCWLEEAGFATPTVLDLEEGRRSLLTAAMAG